MATNISLLEEHLSCPICCDIYRNPVVLQCSHSFCEECLQRYWENAENVICPTCRKGSTQEPRESLALKGLCESIQRKSDGTGHQDICQIHGEKLKLFCFDDKEPICVVCNTSKKHKGHECNPIEEAVTDLRGRLKSPLQTRLTNMNAAKMKYQKWTEHVEAQALRGEEQIRAVFLSFRQFLDEEESARLAALRDEETQKCRVLRDNTDALTNNISELSETIGEIDKEMEVDDVTFLKTYKDIVNRVESSPPSPVDTKMAPGMLIDIAKHVGSLKFKVWAKMAADFENNPVTMDPNTACPKLLVTDDLTRMVYCEEKQVVPDNPERFQIGVLGSEGYKKGCHIWAVDVKDSDHWTLGVVSESIKRNQLLKFDPKAGLWCIRHISGKYWAGVNPRKEIVVKESLQVVRVKLNYTKGELTFINPSTNTELYTFNDKFTDKVYPYFNNCCLNHPLQLCAIRPHF